MEIDDVIIQLCQDLIKDYFCDKRSLSDLYKIFYERINDIIKNHNNFEKSIQKN
ncbi:TPA: hypothetical protein ACG3P3_001482 [Clostridioides difficile]